MIESFILIATEFVKNVFIGLFAALSFRGLLYIPRIVSGATHFLLRKATDKGYTNIVRYMCKLPINFNYQSQRGITSWRYVLRHGNPEIIRELLKNRAVRDEIFPNMRARNLITSNHILSQWGEEGVLGILTSPEFDNIEILWDGAVDGLTSSGLTPLKFIEKALRNPICNVKGLLLSSYVLTDDDIVTLANILIGSNCKVEKITLLENQITDVGAESLANAIRNPDCKLKELSFYGAQQITGNGVINIINAVNVTNNMVKLYFGDISTMTKDNIKRCIDLIAGNLKRSLTTCRMPLHLLNDEDKKEVLRRAPTKTKDSMLLFNAARSSHVKELHRIGLAFYGQRCPDMQNPAISRLPGELTRMLGETLGDNKPCIRF